MKVKLRRNRHNLSHYMLGTCNPGEAIPVACFEVLPGDSINHRINSLIRFMPMAAPIMHRVYARFHTFYVPTRIIWDEFEDFITRSATPTIPQATLGDLKANANCARLLDYMGLQTDTVTAGSTTTVITLMLRCYNAIYNEWLRDKDLITELDVHTDDPADFAVRRVSWRKDYFTAARPWPQLGADVTLPLGTSAPVSVSEVKNLSGTSRGALRQAQASHATIPSTLNSASPQAGSGFENVQITGTADLSTATASSIRQLRRAMNLQALAERLAQFGHDYPAFLASMGVKSSDGRLQRPEYLGGGKVPLSFSEVLQTAEGATTGVGNMLGHGIAPVGVRPYRRFFEEHGYVMTIMTVCPDPVYSTAIPRWWFHGLHDGANDFYTPELERIGQQEIYSKEIYATNPAGGDATVWGYNNRYDEYRRIPSQACADFRNGQPLDHWTWRRGFASLPALNQTFIECNPATDVFQSTATENVLYAVNHNIIAQRMLTKSVVGRVI